MAPFYLGYMHRKVIISHAGFLVLNLITLRG
ncbi:hypothetical protein LCGC14_2541060, partial [marine sediment metagenome]